MLGASQVYLCLKTVVDCCKGKVLRLSSHDLEAVFKAYLVMLSYAHITMFEFVFLIVFVFA